MALEKLKPIEDISSTPTATGYEFSAGETSVTTQFITDVSADSYSLQIYWSGLDHDGTLSFERSNDGVHYTDLVDNSGTPIATTITGTDSLSIINTVCGFGYTKVIYENVDCTTGTIGMNVQRGT